MRLFVLATLVAGLVPVVSSAQNYKAVNNLTVVPLGASSFEVIEGRGEGPRGIWCAAAEYAERRLGAQGRVYVQKGRGPSHVVSGRKGVLFTTNPAKLAQRPSQSLSVSTSRVGAGLPVAHAIQFCRDVFDRDNEIRRRN